MLTLKQRHINSYSLNLMSVQFPLTCVQQHHLHSAQCMHLVAYSDFQEDTTSWKRSVSRTHPVMLGLCTAYMISMTSTTEHVKFCRSSNLLHNLKMPVCQYIINMRQKYLNFHFWYVYKTKRPASFPINN